MDNIAERIKKLIADSLGIDKTKITPDTDLHYDLGADSLDIVDVTVAMEKEFNAPVPDEKLEHMRKVHHFIDYFSNVKQLPLEDPARLKAA